MLLLISKCKKFWYEQNLGCQLAIQAQLLKASLSILQAELNFCYECQKQSLFDNCENNFVNLLARMCNVFH